MNARVKWGHSPSKLAGGGHRGQLGAHPPEGQGDRQ
jgi:hypothetical protein